MSRFGFYVSGSASRVRKVLSEPSCRASSFAFVLTDSPGNESLRSVCIDRGVRLYELDLSDDDRRGARSKKAFLSDVYLELLEATGSDYGLVFGTRLLEGELIRRYRHRLINFHPSVLPAHPGLMSIDAALREGTFLLGNTAFFIDEGVDTGPVLMQSLMHHREYTGYDSVLDRQIPMLLQIVRWLDEGRVSIEGRDVRVEKANYSIGPFVPALEIAWPPAPDDPWTGERGGA